MRRLALAVSSLFALAFLAGCASQNAGYAGYAGSGSLYGECEFGEDCYENEAYEYTCVFYQPAPRIPDRLDIALSTRHPPTRVVHRGDGSQISPPPEAAGSSTPAQPPSASFSEAPVAREPVVPASPSGDRSPRPRN
jgi:hypothetical protein